MKYDAAIIGADADGLAAAMMLAKSGFKTIVLERNEQPGGRLVTREFHPGFWASPFCDEIAAIPAEVFWALDLARHGAIFRPLAAATALWPDRARRLCADGFPFGPKREALLKAALARAAADTAPRKTSIFSQPPADPWPGDAWATRSLMDLLAPAHGDDDLLALAMADVLDGRIAHPQLAGSALHLLASGRSGQVIGGLQRLTAALVTGAQGAGAEISCGLEVADILRRGGRVVGLRLADGAEIAARVVISTLDLKRTLLSLFAWNELPSEVSGRAAMFRMGGGTARLLLALEGLPEVPRFAGPDLFAGPIHISPRVEDFGQTYAAWRSGTVAEHLPITLRVPSKIDPRACAVSSAVVTVTVAGSPNRLFDGAWTHEKRAALRQSVLTVVEHALPGMMEHVCACELIVPPDIEQAVGCTDGDLWGGEIAADQMLELRTWPDRAAPRAPVDGLYLAGSSTTAGVLGTCVSGVLAAQAVSNDLKARRFG